MPELPEVETVINYLKQEILGEKILAIDVKNLKLLKNASLKEFKDQLENKILKNIFRKGKYLIFVLSNDAYMVSHLRMEGKYFVDHDLINRKHDYLIFQLSNNKILSYNDSRQFGTFHLTKNLDQLKELNKIALDPLDEEKNINYLCFFQ